MTAHVHEQLSAYLDDELRPLDRDSVEAHLRDCAACAARLEDMAALDTLARDLPAVAPPGYFDALPGRVRARLRFPSRRRAILPAWSWAVAAAVLLAVVVPRMVVERPAPTAFPADRVQEARPAVTSTAPAVPPPLSDAAGPPAAATIAPPAQPVGAAAGRLARSNEAEKDARREAYAEAPKLRQGPQAEAKQDAHADSDLLVLAKKEQGNRAPAPRAPSAAATTPAPAPPPESLPEESASAQLRASSDEAPEQAEGEAAASKAVAPAPGAPGGIVGGVVGGFTAEPKAAREELRAKRSDKAKPAPASYRSMLAKTAATAEEARALREEWRAFALAHPAGAEGDEARVRVIELGVTAWRRSNDPADRALVRQDALAYLRRDDAAQGQRVRTLLREIGS